MKEERSAAGLVTIERSSNFGGGLLTSAGLGDACVARFVDDQPIPVLVQDFRAVARGGAVDVSWELWSDESMEGYALYRRSAAEDASIVVAQGDVNSAAGSFTDTTVKPATSYEYELVVRTTFGDEYRSAPATVSMPGAGTTLGQNRPNPFNPVTTIAYSLSETARVVVAIYDAAGTLVARLDEGTREAGAYHVDWNGRDSAGSAVASGVYFYQLEGLPTAGTRKMVLLK